MNNKMIFEESGRLGNEIKIEKQKIEKLNEQCLELMDICPHEIVFKYINNHPRKAVLDGNYFCPACGKSIFFLDKEKLLESDFKKSRVIPLINLSLIGSKEVYSAIRREVYDNLDLYYSKDIDTEILSEKMEELLQDKQYNYKDGIKIFMKEDKKR